MYKRLIFACILLSATQLWAQQVHITGIVTSAESGLPIPGVTVQIKGFAGGTMTDTLGKYSIEAQGVKPTLIFRALGLVTREMFLPADQHQLHVQLFEDVTTLREVMVTGYSSSFRDQTTGAYTIVKDKEIENTPFISIDKALQGLVPGLQSAGGSGSPGSLQGIRIRGTGSINAGADPLYVVNGIPVNTGALARNNPLANTLAGINANDIEQITVLKDAVTASAYGSRAANGVIVITLKQGNPGKTRFQFSTEAGFLKRAFESAANRPLNSDEWRELTAEGVRHRYPDLYSDPASALKYVDEAFGVNAAVNTNWLNEVTRTGYHQQYHLAARGGSDKTTFYLSSGYVSQTGNVVATGLKRFTGNMALDHRAGKKLSLSTALVVGSTSQYGPNNGGDFANPVLAAHFLRPSLSPRTAGNELNISPPDFPAGGLYNPVAIAALDSRKTANLKGIFSASVNYQLFKSLKLTSRTGIDYNALEEDSYDNPLYGNAVNENGLVTRGYARYFNWIWSNLADYNRSFAADDLTLHLSAGYEAQKSKHYFNEVSLIGLPNRADLHVPSAGAMVHSGEGSNSDYAFISALAFADISFRQKWLLSGSFRRDGSSRFGSDRRFGNFWSVGLAWHVDREKFFSAVSFIQKLKLRSSYGLNGNASIGNYSWQAAYTYGMAYNYLGGIGSAPSTPGNNNLTWELNKPLNFGMDISLMRGRTRIAVDWYSRITSNLLIDAPLSGTSGFAAYKANAGSMRNRGLEIDFSAVAFRSAVFSWDIFLTVAFNKNRILSLPGRQDIITGQFIRRTGNDVQSFYMRQWAGVNPETGAPRWYKDADSKEVVENYNLAGRFISGSASPRSFGSFGSGLRYMIWSVDFQFYYSYGHMVRDAWASYTQSDGSNPNFNVVSAQLDRWQKPGDLTNVPKYVHGGANASNAVSSRFLYHGDYLRLRNVTFGCKIPPKLIARTGLYNARVYIRGANILTWVRDKSLPYDPETDLNSTTNFDVFIPKTFTAGLRIDF